MLTKKIRSFQRKPPGAFNLPSEVYQVPECVGFRTLGMMFSEHDALFRVPQKLLPIPVFVRFHSNRSFYRFLWLRFEYSALRIPVRGEHTHTTPEAPRQPLGQHRTWLWQGMGWKDRSTGNSDHRRQNFPIRSARIDPSKSLLSKVDSVVSSICIRTKPSFDERPLQPYQSLGREIGVNCRSG